MASVTILSDNGATSGSAGLKTSGGNDGVLILQTTTSGGTATNAVTIDTNQNVGVGISSIPNYNSNLRTVSFNNTSGVVHDYCVNGTRTGSFVCQSSGFDLTTQTAIPLIFSTNATERMRLDSSGNLGLGVTPNTWRTNDKVMQVGGNVYSGFVGAGYGVFYGNNFYRDSGGFKYIQSGVSAGRFDFDYTSGGAFAWNIAPSGTAGNAITFTTAMTLDANGTLLVGTTSGNSNFKSITYNANTYYSLGLKGDTYGLRFVGTSSAYRIEGVDNSLIASYNPVIVGAGGYIAFETGSAGGGSLAERARIDSSGNLLVGTTTALNSLAKINAYNTSGGNGGLAVGYGSSAGQYRVMYLISANGGLYFDNASNAAYLNSAGAWTNASDARLKNSITDIKYGLSAVLSTQPRSYKMNDLEGDYIGFVAQELQTVIPEVVSGDPEKQLGVDYGSLVAVAFKAIQEQQAIITQLQADVAALKGQA